MLIFLWIRWILWDHQGDKLAQEDPVPVGDFRLCKALLRQGPGKQTWHRSGEGATVGYFINVVQQLILKSRI